MEHDGAGDRRQRGVSGHYIQLHVATTSPDKTLLPSAPPMMVGLSKGEAFTGSCEVMLTFDVGPQVPATAVLVVGGSSSLPLAVVRNVTYFYYLGVPAIFGGAMALFLLLSSLLFVRVCDLEHTRQRPFMWPSRKEDKNASARKLLFLNMNFWRYEVFASGAWSLSDSWATNLVAVVAVVTTLLALIPATDLLFRGVFLDRFSILNGIAAGIAAAAPLVLAVRYARWLRLHPGVTDDATLLLPREALPASIVRVKGKPVKLAGGTLIELPAGTALTPPPSDDAKARRWTAAWYDRKPATASPPQGPTRALLPKSTDVELIGTAEATRTAREWVVLLAATTPPKVALGKDIAGDVARRPGGQADPPGRRQPPGRRGGMDLATNLARPAEEGQVRRQSSRRCAKAVPERRLRLGPGDFGEIRCHRYCARGRDRVLPSPRRSAGGTRGG